MDHHCLTEYNKKCDTVAAQPKYPLNLLTLHGKIASDPNSTFCKISAYQIQNSLADGLPNLTLLIQYIGLSQPKHILQQVQIHF